MMNWRPLVLAIALATCDSPTTVDSELPAIRTGQDTYHIERAGIEYRTQIDVTYFSGYGPEIVNDVVAGTYRIELLEAKLDADLRGDNVAKRFRISNTFTLR